MQIFRSVYSELLLTPIDLYGSITKQLPNLFNYFYKSSKMFLSISGVFSDALQILFLTHS